MKKVTAIVLALALATPALADMPEGCNPNGWQPFDEDVNGNNCPATETEKKMGNVLTFGVIALGILAASGKVNFPLSVGG